MSKFKVGDKVRSISWQKGVCGTITKSNGQCFDVEADEGQNVQNPFWVINGKRGFCHFEAELELVEKPRREFIVIRRSGAETIAELRHDREVIKSGKAICNTSDTFDFDTGAKLAFDRLMGRLNPLDVGKTITIPCAHSITVSAPQPAHMFKVGDRVLHKVYGLGTILEVLSEETDVPYFVKPDNADCGITCWAESRVSPAPEPPKFYTGKVLMIGCDYPDRNHLINHLFEFKDGKYIGHEMRGIMFHYEPYTSFDYIKSVHTASTWIEVKE